MTKLKIMVGNISFIARLETDKAPRTCAEFRKLLPYRQKIIHARWSGEACWIPLGDFDLKVESENHTTYPSRGEILFYPNGISETEILFPYGSTHFASKMGSLAGNHFLTITSGMEKLEEVGRRCLWEGAQDIAFEYFDADCDTGRLIADVRRNGKDLRISEDDDGNDSDSTISMGLKIELLKSQLAERRNKRRRS